MADAFAYQRLRSADIEHERVLESVEAWKRMEAIKASSIELTRIAVDRARGRQPSITEARAIEVAIGSTLSTGEIRGTRQLRTEASDNHNEMMEAIFEEMDEGSGYEI